MPNHLKKITLTVLPLVGLLFAAPLTFAYDSRRERGRAYNEIPQDHQQGHQALAAEARANGYYHFKHAQRRLRREHQRLHRDPNAQHEDYHDGNRYPS